MCLWHACTRYADPFIPLVCHVVFSFQLLHPFWHTFDLCPCVYLCVCVCVCVTLVIQPNYIPDTSLMPPQVLEIFERVRNNADIMPTWQLEVSVSLPLYRIRVIHVLIVWLHFRSKEPTCTRA